MLSTLGQYPTFLFLYFPFFFLKKEHHFSLVMQFDKHVPKKRSSVQINIGVLMQTSIYNLTVY